ncbi:major capsid protein [Gordonia phage Reyja]|uniref:Major capsid protein n=1 Tax=Gordonia phage Reyja TaxID=2571250 RepID=A0A4D6T806_9CAUD|nr:major capsid protein [Gordonia phage Reyja]QCG77753.1 major capsid protein [Gordonia phage Reyja]
MPTATKVKELGDAMQASIKAAREIAEKAAAESREMTDVEVIDYKTAMERTGELLTQFKSAKADFEVLSEAADFAKSIGPAAVEDVKAQQYNATRERVKALGLQVVESDAFKSLLAPFKDSGRIPEKARIQSDPIPVKSLIVGGSDTSAGAFVTPEQTGIVEMLGRKPLTIRDLISVRRTGSDVVEYVVQTSHTNAAAPVPEATSSAAPTAPGTAGPLVQAAGGGYKPEGSWAFERRSTSVKTIAEWVPATKRALADVAQMEGLINDELRADIAEAEENQILNGSGSGENLTGIMNTSGVQTQAFDTDIFVSTRKAITKARTIGRVAPNAVLLSPADMETIDLARDEQGRFYGAGPFAMGPRTLWGLPTIESESIVDGTALVGDFSKAVLWDREETTVTISDSHMDFFTRNLVAVLAEERVAFGVTRPTAFVKTDVAA